MKKQLLFGFVVLATFSVLSQNHRKMIANPVAKEMQLFKPLVFHESTSTALTHQPTRKTTGAPYKRIAASSNVYGGIVAETRALQYHEALNTLGFIYRASGTQTASIPNGNSGTILYSWSSNNGSSWDSTVLVASATKFTRYPAGAMYNPAGNVDPMNAYVVGSGPWHPGQDWKGNYFVSKQLSVPYSNSSGNVTYVDNSALVGNEKKQEFARTDFQVTSDGIAHVLGGLYKNINATTVSDQGFRGAMINKGIFNAGSFTWTVDSLKPQFKTATNGGKHGYAIANMAWSEDGAIGYVIFCGVDADAITGTPMNSFQPYVYKTTDAGATWSRHAPLFDFTSISSVSDRLFPTRGVAGNLLKPFISFSEGSSATVDANGELHLFASMASALSEHIDSLGRVYKVNFNNVWEYLYDFKTTSTGGWDAMIIDSLANEGPIPSKSNWLGSGGSGENVGYDARLQISRTTDGKYLVYSWADSDSNIVSSRHTSLNPDIFMKGYDVVNNKMTCVKNMSLNKPEVNYNSYFFYTSPRIVALNTTTLLIPTSITKSEDGSNNADKEVIHYYIDDNIFTLSEFSVTVNAPGCKGYTQVGIKEEIPSVSKVSLRPNPVSSSGIIDITLNEDTKVTVSVMNSLGQLVYATSFEGSMGENSIELNTSYLSNGLYIYQVKTLSGRVVAHKFVVDK